MDKEPSNILVRMPNWIGDMVMGTPVLTDLRKRFPKAEITAMCRTPVSTLLKEETAIDELFSFSRPSNSFLQREKQRNIIAKIRAGQYDLALLLVNSFSSAWWCWQGNIPRRIGYTSFLRRFLLTDPVSWPKKNLHQIDFYKELLSPLGISRSTTPPRLCVLQREVQDAKEILYKRGYAKRDLLIAMNPGAAYGSAKCWPSDRFCRLALELEKEGCVIFIGDQLRSNLVKEICNGKHRNIIDLVGTTSLRELACIIKECDLLITNDSGPMHIAAAFNTPVISLFGSTDDLKTGPYGQMEGVINKRVNCSPCFKRKCPIDFRCMNMISVEEVAKKAKAILHRIAVQKNI